MNTRPRLLAALALGAALAPAAALAELAVTTGDVNLRAGPDVSYPRVAVLGRGVGLLAGVASHCLSGVAQPHQAGFQRGGVLLDLGEHIAQLVHKAVERC